MTWNLNQGEDEMKHSTILIILILTGISSAQPYSGSILAWGDNYYGQCSVPEPNQNFVAVSSGDIHVLALKTNGSIVAWGDNTYGQCRIPYPNENFIAVAAGDCNSLGLKIDGSIIAWGENNFGQSTVPEPNEGFVSMAAGRYHCLGLKEDNTVVGWGTDQLGLTVVPEPNQDFVAVTAGYLHSMALRAYNTGTESDPPVIESFGILSVFPNPMTSITTLNCIVNDPSSMTFEVFDISGRKVRRIEIGAVSRGLNSFTWDGLSESGEQMSTGIYFLHISVEGGEHSTSKVVLIR